MYSRLGNHDYEVCVIPPSNPPTSVGIFQFKGIFIENTIWRCFIYWILASNCKGRTPCYFSFFRKINQIKPF